MPNHSADLLDPTIIVTGSRIRRDGIDTPVPAIVVRSEDVDALGITNVGDALNMIPGFGPPSSSAAGEQKGSFGSGHSFVDFLGLGSQRTLTLVDGHRFVSSNTATIFGPAEAGSQVDLNTIPMLMIDRIETIAVGGAPVYGSDAIAGTVNIILKDHFEGIKLDTRYGITEKGDAAEYRLAGLVGTTFSNDRGNILASFEYNHSNGLTDADRKRTARGLYFVSPNDPDYPYDNQLIEDRRISLISPFGMPLTNDIVPGDLGLIGRPGTNRSIKDAAGNALAFNAEGELVPIDFGDRHGLVNSSGGNGFSLVPVTNLLSSVERYVGTVRANYELSNELTAFIDFNYARSKGTQLREQPAYNSWLFGSAGDLDGNLIIPLSNRFLTDTARATISENLDFDEDGVVDQDFFYMARASPDLLSGRGTATVELYRVVGGFEGELGTKDRAFHWNVSANYGRSKTVGASRELVQQNFLNALAGCPENAANSPIATISSVCVPFNPFGNQNGQAVKDYVTTIARPKEVNDQLVISANVTGSPFAIWSGDVQISVGYEHRAESASFDPATFFYGSVDPADPTGSRLRYGRSVPIDPVSGKFNTYEFSGEALIPLVSPGMDIPLVHALGFSGAVRYIDHSLTGDDLSWTAGGHWQPIEDVSIRGNFTRSIRSPAITELFNPTSSIFARAPDPCDARFINGGPAPAVRKKNCTADGLPANFTSNIVDVATRGSLSGNTDLANEKADSWTIGVVLRPRFASGFSLSVDWVDISLKGAILSVDPEQTLEACYDASTFRNMACDKIDRDASGQIEFIRTGYLNAASYDYRGLIADLFYRINTPFLGQDSRITLQASYQYIDQLEQRIGKGDLTTLRGGIGYSKNQALASILYQNGPIDLYLQGRYIGAAVVDPDADEATYDHFRIDDTVIFRTSLGARIADNLSLRLVVNNLFNAKAPYPVPAAGGVVTYFDGIIGRSFKLSATVDF
ncbi:TonB-dependent receptor domain-containing protein [Croceicoccus estronivorus]|uniref:TonB-dependent receptor domain-containing protein n=1 Tax=Croceicoccus estronivorus TaxID=1172626 RepID=UPI00147953FC|nr:TonB-dependent receptor [Croceicoccus estronivorus]